MTVKTATRVNRAPLLPTQQAEAVAAAAGDIAGLVGLSAEDVCSVLAPGPAEPRRHAGEAGLGAAGAALQQALQLARRLEAALAGGDWQGVAAALGGLDGALAAAGDLCRRAEAAIASSETAAALGSGAASFQGLEQRLREASAQVAALEERLG